MDIRQPAHSQQRPQEHHYQPRILGIADATCYLVGAADSNNNFIELKEEANVQSVGSLAAAKQLLRQHNYQSAELEYQTAYDEMCGLASTGVYREIIKL